MSLRNSYDANVEILGRVFSEIIIDQHYKLKHSEITDSLILNILYSSLPKEKFWPLKVVNNYSYYVFDPVYFNKRPYRIILVTEFGFSYLGVVNAFRVKEKSHGLSKK